MSRPLSFVSFSLLALVYCGLLTAKDPDSPRIGAEIDDLRFKDIRYLPRSLKDLGDGRATVLVFTNTTCPIAQKYWPKLRRILKAREEKQQKLAALEARAEELKRELEVLEAPAEKPATRKTRQVKSAKKARKAAVS